MSPGREKGLDFGGFFRVALVGASLEAGREAHLHLGVDASGKSRVRIKVGEAAAKQKQVEGFVTEAFGGRARRERAIKILGSRFCNRVGYIYARIAILHRHPQEIWRIEVEAFTGAFAESLVRRGVERERGLEIGSGGSVFDTGDAFGEAKAFGLGRFGVKEAFEASPDVGGSR